MVSTGQKWVATGVAAAVVHFSGAVAGLEHEVSPGIARTSLNLFHEIQPEWQGAVTVLKELAKGTPEDKIAMRAACAFLNTTYAGSPDRETNRLNILAQVPPVYQGVPGVQAAVGAVATKLTGATAPGSAGHVYRKACFGIG